MPYFPPSGGGGGGAPSGPAGGSLTGTYPNPTLASGAVSATELASSSITATKIATGAVSTAKIADNAVTAAKIASETITAAEIASGAIGSSEIADGAVGAAELATGLTKVARTYLVMVGGNDTTADGSAARPFATVTAALALATSEVPVTPGQPGIGYVEIKIAAGVYTENITVSRINVILRGAGSETGRGQATKINGSITVNASAGIAKFNDRVVLANLFVNATANHAVLISGTGQFGVDIDNCYLYMLNNSSAPVLKTTNTNAGRCRTYIVESLMNCEKAGITADIQGTMDLFVGINTFFQGSTSGATGAMLKLSDSASAQCDQCSFDSINTDAAIQVGGTQAGIFKLALSSCGINNSLGDGIEFTANGLTFIAIRNIFSVATAGKNVIKLTSPATAVTYANSGNIAAPTTSTTKSVGVTSVAYSTV